ncbi:MAG TPA: protein translocase subunit SecD [Alphaproteobacteria bacterium]|nr:protein translocase subunit SecD [Alphaproteobacteria bacterium]
MLQFPTWKIVLVLLLCAFGVGVAAPNLFSRDAAEKLPSWLPHKQISLGLDLQGGSHLLMEVDVKSVVTDAMNSLVDEIRTELRKAQIGYVGLGVQGTGVTFKVTDPAQTDDARTLVRKINNQLDVAVVDGQFTLKLGEQALKDETKRTVDQSIEIISRRVDETGTREPTIQREGEDRILVQLPGVKDPERIKQLLGKTAKLTLHLVDPTASLADAEAGHVPPGTMLVPESENQKGRGPGAYVVGKRVVVGGERLTDAQATFEQGRPVVSFRFDTAGGKRFGDATRDNVGKQLAIVLDGKVISAPVIREPILGGNGIISGNFTTEEAQDLALLLRAGALPAPLTILEERSVGPSLGEDSIRAGKIACVVGFALVVVFMALVYGFFGLIANVALLINLVLLLGALSLLQATLTLPGIAGIVLTMGMAVDANVLIYERIREEVHAGRTPISAIATGFERAFATIVDSNLTTFIAGALLYVFGSGPVKGFAVTLSLGLMTTLFTAVMVTRLMVVMWLWRARPKALPV